MTQLYASVIGMGIYYMKYILGDEGYFSDFALAINIPMVIGLILLVAVILVLVYIMIYISLGQRKKEKALFHKMIDDPSDATVSNYIIALESLNSNLVYRFGTDPYDYNRRAEDRHRQAQGWNHIKTCQTISENKKKELKALYNKYGTTAI